MRNQILEKKLPLSLVARLSCMAAILLGAAGCSTTRSPPIIDRDASSPSVRGAPRIASPRKSAPRGGGYYKDDGPGDSIPPDLDKVTDAQPRIEPLHRYANRPYNVFGLAYVPMRSITPFRQSGIASWYGKKFHGQRTSSGEIYDMYAMTAAHPTLPIPSFVRVSNQQNGRSVIVRVNDRGPFHSGRVIDLSFAAAFKLGYVVAGSTPVQVELLQPDDISKLASNSPSAQNSLPTREDLSLPASPPVQVASPNDRLSDSPGARIGDTAGAYGVSRSEALSGSAPPANIGSEGVSIGTYLQLGAFSSRDNAESFRARIYRELAWLNEPIAISDRDGLFRLHLGPYRDREQAAGMAARLKQEIDLKPVYVTR